MINLKEDSGKNRPESIVETGRHYFPTTFVAIRCIRIIR